MSPRWMRKWLDTVVGRMEGVEEPLAILTKGKTSPIYPRRIEALVTSMPPSERDELLAVYLWWETQERVRNNVRAVERDAQTVKEKAPDPADDLYEGRWVHGSSSKRSGAAIRGCDCEECTAHMAAMRAIEERMVNRVTELLDEYATDLRMEWTAELLESDFALGDGTHVTWGDATIDQHQKRVDMLQATAQGTLETAARHQRAIIDLESAGAETLRELAAS
jgi:hypothetical protein